MPKVTRQRVDVTYPGRPTGGWRSDVVEKPSFSSYMMNRTVFDQIFGLETGEITLWENHPRAGADGGCSSKPFGGVIQGHGGQAVVLDVGARSRSGRPIEGFVVERDEGSMNCLKYSRMLSEIPWPLLSRLYSPRPL